MTIKVHVSTADVLPVTNSMSSSDQMSINDYATCEIQLVATHVNATLVSLVMDSNVPI